jgi:hypothetical protein
MLKTFGSDGRFGTVAGLLEALTEEGFLSLVKVLRDQVARVAA